MAVHTRSLDGIDDPVGGPRVRQKRLEQAQSIAQKVQALQDADPDVHLVVIGDFNAFEFTDGYVDVVGQISGNFTPEDNLLSGPDLVDPDLANQVLTLPPEERYSFIFRGNAQVLDHALTSQALTPAVTGFAYGRGNADAALDLINDDSTPLRSSDHDGLVLYIAADLSATIDVDPDRLHLGGRGTWVTVYIELPEGLDVKNIINTPESPVMLSGQIPAVTDPKYGFVTSEGSYITDHDGDGILERMVKFDRSAVQEILVEGDEVAVIVTGPYNAGSCLAHFRGEDVITVIDKGQKGKKSKTVGVIPSEWVLAQNAPNPFNPLTQITYGLLEPCRVRLTIYNLLGQEVARLVDTEQRAGYHTITWDTSGLSSGVYLYRLEAGRFGETKRMMLMK
jgi:hypothetical protein